MTNYCHLSYEDRKNIEDGLNDNKSINQIAKEIGRNHSTVLREIDRNKVYYKPKQYSNYKNNNYDRDISCERLSKSPYVCNGCKKRSGCRKERFTYYARKADDSYKELISKCRKGINLTEEEIYNINKTITPLIKKGQSYNHLYINHPDILDFSKTSFYNYISEGVFEFKPIDMPRMVRYKKRQNTKRRTRQEREIRIGRTYEDFKNYIFENPDLNIVEMDTVEGISEDFKCLLTLYWRKTHFMMIFLLESQTTDEVTQVFEYLQQELLEDEYKKLFPIILTDNGHEFFDVQNIECDHKTGEQLSQVFYCDPHESWQKGGIEKNHELIRYVLPKGTSFENLTQNDFYILANHINSLCRKSLNNKCPFKAMTFICSEEVLNRLYMYYIEPDEVTLNKSLLKK